MIEKIILDYLAEQLDVPVSLEQPNPAPTAYVLLEKTGSTKQNFIESATIAIQSYADSLYETALLNEAVKSAMSDIVVLDDISACRLNGDYNFTDVTRHRYRYQSVYNIVHY